MNRLRHALRERTQATHARLDGMFSDLDLKCREDYTHFLATQAAAVLAVEAELDSAGAADVIPEWEDRKRSQAIMADLQALGCPLSTIEEPIDWISDRASIIGTTYVLEGSRLGGKMLLKVAQGSPDALIKQATAFLRHGDGKRFWPSFDLLLADLELSSEETERMVMSAERTFWFFHIAAVTLAAAGRQMPRRENRSKSLVS